MRVTSLAVGIISLLVMFVLIQQEAMAQRRTPAKKEPEKKETPAPAQKEPAKKETGPAIPVPAVPSRQTTSGVVGEIQQIDFAGKAPKIVIKDNEGVNTEVSIKELKPGTLILVTYRKEGNDNELIALSVIRSADAPETPGGPAKK